MVNTLTPLSLYIHFPWCIRKCPYCDFNSHEAKNGIAEIRYIDALITDLIHDLQWIAQTRPLVSIFMGGGTPSLFSADSIDKLLTQIRLIMPLTTNCEITMEANPGTFDSVKFKEFRQTGINRLSIGIQSFNNEHLQKLGRIHDAQQAIRAVELAKDAGFENINLDLMFGLPQQTHAEVVSDVQTALDLQTQHLSFYQLTLEPNTYFHKFPPSLPEDDAIYQLQQAGQHLLNTNGFRQYEISAYAQTDRQCQHNRNYWQFGDYLGIGAGAHGKLSLELPGKIVRTAKTKHPELYMQQPIHHSVQAINPAQLPLEFLMNHLRLREGFSLQHYQRCTGLPISSLQPSLNNCINAGLLEQHQQRICCSERGWDFLDEILERFL